VVKTTTDTKSRYEKRGEAVPKFCQVRRNSIVFFAPIWKFETNKKG
jgi:hypothetical protein